MWDWIISNKEWIFSGIGVAALLGVIQLARSRMGRSVPNQQHVSSGFSPGRSQPQESKPLVYELLPLSFEITLNQQIPQVNIWLYAVNYLPKELLLRSVQVRNFYLSGGPDLVNIPATDEIKVAARHSHRVLFRRALIDAEVRAIEKSSQTYPWNASLTVTCQALAEHKEVSYASGLISLSGWVTGKTSA